MSSSLGSSPPRSPILRFATPSPSASPTPAGATYNLYPNPLGLTCEETIGFTDHNPPRPVICTNGPATIPGMPVHPCNFARPQAHRPFTHNVCMQCNATQRPPRDQRINAQLPTFLIPLCKQDSDRQHRLHPLGYNGCHCIADLNAGWKCRACLDHEVAPAITGNAQLIRHNLMRTHRLRNKKPPRGHSIVVTPAESRKTPACRGLRNRHPCGKATRAGRNVAKICLGCDGIVMPPVPPAPEPVDPLAGNIVYY